MQILALAGIMMVNVIILSKIKIKIDDSGSGNSACRYCHGYV